MSTRIICPQCIEKQEEIYRLREEVKKLKVQLRIQQRKITEGYFGSATPSSKKPVKNNCDKPAKQKNRGGARLGGIPAMGEVLSQQPRPIMSKQSGSTVVVRNVMALI